MLVKVALIPRFCYFLYGRVLFPFPCNVDLCALSCFRACWTMLLTLLCTRQTIRQESGSSPGISLKMSQDDSNPQETLVGGFCHKLSIQGGVGGP